MSRPALPVTVLYLLYLTSWGDDHRFTIHQAFDTMADTHPDPGRSRRGFPNGGALSLAGPT